MPRKPLDIKLTDHPFSRERSPQLLSLPSWRRTGVGRAHKHNKPQQKAGANVSIILGHFQKCLTGLFALFVFFLTKIKNCGKYYIIVHILQMCYIYL